MPMTDAERQRRRREKLKNLEPEKYEEKKRKHAQYMRNKRKPIGQLTETEQNRRRRQWREANEKRKKKKTEAEKQKIAKKPIDAKATVLLKRKLSDLKNIVEKLTRENSTLKKRLYRQKVQINRLLNPDSTQTSVAPIKPVATTPMSKAEAFVENLTAITPTKKDQVKRQLLECNVLSESLAHIYKEHCNDNVTKNVLKKIASNDIVKKYKLKTVITKKLGLKGRIRTRVTKDKQMKTEVKKVKSFFIRDDVSRATPGKRDCIRKNKIIKQKRFLLDDMLKLHAKYVSEGGKYSYTSFVRYKPFYVVHPKLTDRDTCACIRHTNLQLKAQKLKKLGLIKSSDLEKLVNQVTCSSNSYSCMHLKCSCCKNKKLEIKTDIPNDTECCYLAWVRKEHKYIKRNKDGTSETVTAKKYSKDLIETTIGELKEQFQKDLQLFKRHFYNINRQHSCYREAIDNIKEDEACIIVDFSENFMCKMSQEIQSLHFGASRAQITLHTGVIYRKNAKPKSFASISPCNEHGPGAIWSHLEAVIEYIRNNYPEIKILHVFSDGPNTQYKQKKTFYVFGQLIEDKMFSYGTWSFFESSHGKGAADGVGGSLKRTLDKQIAFGRDICSARDAFDVLKRRSKKVKLFYVSEEDIQQKLTKIPQNLVPIKGSMQLHQLVYCDGELKYRDLSCFCGPSRGLCCCFDIQKHNLGNSLISRQTCKSPMPGPSKKTNSTSETCKKSKSTTKAKAPRKRKVRYESVSSNTDSDVVYAESDDSYNVLNDLGQDDDDDIQSLQQDDVRNKRLKACLGNKNEEVHENDGWAKFDDDYMKTKYKNLNRGQFVVVAFKGGKKKTVNFKYVCVIQDFQDDDVIVAGLRNIDTSYMTFKLEEKDISYVKRNQIVEMLEDPNIHLKGERVFYKFSQSVDLSEFFD